MRARVKQLTDRARSVGERALHTRLGRAGMRYWIGRGNLLAGGIAYAALFSIFAGLAIGYTIFMAVLGGNAELRETVLQSIDQALPGVLDEDPEEGLIQPDDLLVQADFTVASIVTGAVLVWSALRVMIALRRAIRTMFGIVAPPESFLVGKLRDVTGFVAVALGVLTSSVLGLAAGAFAQGALNLVGVDGAVARQLLQVLGFVVAGVVDGLVIILLLRLTAGARPPRADLLLGAGLGALASGLLRLVGTSVISAAGNPLLASFAALVTVLVWVNVLARVLLFVAAFTANPPFPMRAESYEEVRYRTRPNYVTVSEPTTLSWQHQPVTGTIVPEPALRPTEQGEEEDGPRPYWGGALGRLRRRRAERLEAKARRLRGEEPPDARDKP